MMVVDADGFRKVPLRRSGQHLRDFTPSSRPDPATRIASSLSQWLICRRLRGRLRRHGPRFNPQWL